MARCKTQPLPSRRRGRSTEHVQWRYRNVISDIRHYSAAKAATAGKNIHTPLVKVQPHIPPRSCTLGQNLQHPHDSRRWQAHCFLWFNNLHLIHYFPQPKEIRDIKQFIKITQRKDASGELQSPCLFWRVLKFLHVSRGTYKENPLESRQWEDADQIQGPVFAVSLHTISRRPREGGETKAESTTRCVTVNALIFSPTHVKLRSGGR